MRYASLSAAALFLLAGCGGEPASETTGMNVGAPDGMLRPDADVPPENDIAAEPGNAATTKGGDGSALNLAPLRAADADAIDGELACSFAARAGEQAILLGRADVGDEARARAVVRLGDTVESMTARAAGGFDAMARGASFAGKGLTVTIDRQSRQETGNESTAHRATLLAQRADGAERRFDGLWTCGP